MASSSTVNSSSRDPIWEERGSARNRFVTSSASSSRALAIGVLLVDLLIQLARSITRGVLPRDLETPPSPLFGDHVVPRLRDIPCPTSTPRVNPERSGGESGRRRCAPTTRGSQACAGWLGHQAEGADALELWQGRGRVIAVVIEIAVIFQEQELWRRGRKLQCEQDGIVAILQIYGHAG
jgi:hypothetical protein